MLHEILETNKSRKGYHLITLNNSELLFFTAVLVNHYFALQSTCLIDQLVVDIEVSKMAETITIN